MFGCVGVSKGEGVTAWTALGARCDDVLSVGEMVRRAWLRRKALPERAEQA